MESPHAADDLDAVFLDDANPEHEKILKKYLEVWFKKADADKDNFLSPTELPKAFDFFEEAPDFEGEAESAVRLADKNNDTSVDSAELQGAPVHVKDFMAAHASVHSEL